MAMTEMSLSEFNNRQESSKTKKQIKLPVSGIMIVGAALVALISFLAGVQYQKGKTPTASTTQTASNQSGSNSGGPGGYGGGFKRGDRAFGTVSSVSSTSITVQTRNGSDKTYDITNSTTVNNDGQSASVSDIQTGNTVILTLDSSNTQNVTSISLNPSFGGGPGGNVPGSTSQNTPTGSSTSGV